MMAWQQNFAYPWFGMQIHMLFAVITFLGVVLFLIWAFRVLDKKKMFSWAVWLLALGILGALLTAEMGGASFGKVGSVWGNRCGFNQATQAPATQEPAVVK
ncbi:MAG: hypothetical protein Q8P62_03990 [Candidatus Peregrinibacteria bacterium]|nr:hypothetical protein [Candidatus Peregrinibacteria bacterium]